MSEVSLLSYAARSTARRRAAVKALRQSIFVDVVCSYLVYRFSVTRFPVGSLLPLFLSSVPPILSLAWGFIRRKPIDFIGLIAAEDIAFSILSVILAHTQSAALVVRSLQNAALGLIFIGSIVLNKPLVLYVSRLVLTVEDPKAKIRFDLTSAKPGARRVYRNLTWIWAAVMFCKSAGSVLIALSISAQNYLVFAPIWTYSTDIVLVCWSIHYGSAQLRGCADNTVPARTTEGMNTLGLVSVGELGGSGE